MEQQAWGRSSRGVKEAPPRIAQVEVFEYRRALDGRSWNPAWRWHERRAPLVRITATDGIAGLGEAWSEQTRIAELFAHAGRIAPGLLGRDAADIEAIHRALWTADGPADWIGAAVASAIDIALWDMRARRTGLALHAALGAEHATAPVYASGGLYADGKDSAALAREMAGYAQRGFRAFKMKIGALDLGADLERVRAARVAVGPSAELIVDAVGRLTRSTAPDWLAALHALGARAIQAPLPRGEIAQMAELQRMGLLDIVADEAEFRPDAFQTLLENGAVGWLQFNPALAGGITRARVLIRQALARGVPVTLQCHATAVLQATCLQLAALAGVRSAEFHMFHDHLHALLPRAMTTLRDGGVRLGTEIGLGIDPGFLDSASHDAGELTRVLTLHD